MRRRIASRLSHWWAASQWLLIGLLGLLAFGLGFAGFSAVEEFSDAPLLSRLYLSLQLFALESGAVPGPIPVILEVARFLAPAVTITAGIKALGAVFRERIQALKIRTMSGHSIVCGLGDRGTYIALAFKGAGETVVGIEADPQAVGALTCREADIPVVIGDATTQAILERARTERAAEVICIGPTDEDNIQIALLAKRLSKRNVKILVHLRDAKLNALLQEESEDPTVELRDWNTTLIAARTWADEHKLADPQDPASDPPHLLLIGMGELGHQLFVESVGDWLAMRPDSRSQATVTVIDPQATHRCERLRKDRPRLNDFVNLCPVDSEFDAESIGRILALRRMEIDPITHAFVCTGDPTTNLSIGVGLARMAEDDGFRLVLRLLAPSDLTRQPRPPRMDRIHYFIEYEQTCQPEIIRGETPIERGAQSAAGIYRQKYGKDHWGSLSEPHRQSNRRQVMHNLYVKLPRAGCEAVRDYIDAPLGFSFEEDEVELLAKLEHERWMAEKCFEGWTPGTPRDDYALVHPDLIPWSDLHEEVREKDRDAVRAIPQELLQMGLRVRRRTETEG